MRQFEGRLITLLEGKRIEQFARGSTGASGVRFALATAGASECLIIGSVVITGHNAATAGAIFLCEGTNASDASKPLCGVHFAASEPRTEHFVFTRGLPLLPNRTLLYNATQAFNSLLVSVLYNTKSP